MAINKKTARIRRARKARARISIQGVPRLSVHRTGKYIYAQVITADMQVVVSASTLQKELREGLKGTKNMEAATAVGKAVAEKALAAGIKEVAFDRSGFRYHGRIKALAEAARETGLQF